MPSLPLDAFPLMPSLDAFPGARRAVAIPNARAFLEPPLDVQTYCIYNR